MISSHRGGYRASNCLRAHSPSHHHHHNYRRHVLTRHGCRCCCLRSPIILPDSLRDAAGQKRVVCNPMEEDPDYVGERRCVTHSCQTILAETLLSAQ